MDLSFLRSGKGSISLPQFLSFWTDSLPLSFYINELLRYYIEIEKSRKSSGVSLEHTISTLYFLVLSGRYEVTDSEFQTCFEEARQRWDYHRQGHESFSPLLDEIMATILNAPNNPDDHIHLIFSHSLLFSPRISSHADISYNNYLGQQFKAVTNHDITNYQSKGFPYLSQNPAFCILEKAEFILNYTFIKSYLTTAGYIPVSILDLFHRKIQEIIINLRGNDFKLAQCSLLPLLHMLENILTAFPIISYDSMDALIIDLDILRRWPLPYGAAADKLMHMIIKELKSPGSAVRYRIREEFPMIDYHTPVFELHDSQALGRASGYLILDSSDSIESSFFYMIESINKAHNKEKLQEVIKKLAAVFPVNTTSVYAHVNRTLIVLFVFSLFLEITTTDLSHMAGLSSENLFSLYKRILQMVEKIEGEEMDRARTLQEWFVLELFEEVKTLKSDRTNPLTEPLFVYLSEFEIFFPKVPQHALTVIDLAQCDPQAEAGEATGYIINTSSEAIASDDLIIDIFRQVCGPSEHLSFPIKIILTGSDAVTHRTLKSYMNCLISSKYMAESDIRFYSVPTYQVTNTLAMYLASVDAWYTRHVYLPLHMRPWVPRLEAKIDQKHLPKKESAFDPHFATGVTDKNLPAVMCEALIQDYLSEATHVIPINIYRVKCYRNDLSVPDEIIPMCMYLEMGAIPAAKRLQDLNSSFKDKSYLEVIESKAFRFRSITLQLQVSQMDLMGNHCGIDECVVRHIYSLSIGNVPREQDKCMAPVPQAEWLELSFIERDSAEQEANLLKEVKKKKSKQPQSQTNIAISSLYSNLHISGGKISMGEVGDTDIVVDGMLYGPFKQVVVEPWIGEDSLQIALPLYTYLDSEN